MSGSRRRSDQLHSHPFFVEIKVGVSFGEICSAVSILARSRISCKGVCVRSFRFSHTDSGRSHMHTLTSCCPHIHTCEERRPTSNGDGSRRLGLNFHMLPLLRNPNLSLTWISLGGGVTTPWESRTQFTPSNKHTVRAFFVQRAPLPRPSALAH